MRVDQLVAMGVEKIGASSSSAKLDAQLILQHFAHLTRLQIVADPALVVSDYVVKSYLEGIERRSRCVPVAYIIEHKEFYGLKFSVTPQVLIPRPETELLVEYALRHLQRRGQNVRILELGTGSGCIAIALSRELGELDIAHDILATDLSRSALQVAELNASKHACKSICFIEAAASGDWYGALVDQAQFDLILSNPPYIAENDPACSAELQFEPQGALYAGADGLADLRPIVSGAANLLKKDGALLLEIGYQQATSVIELGEGAGLQCSAIIKDYAGCNRVLRLERATDS